MELSTQILSDLTVHMKYAKFIPELQRRETWDEVVTRNMDMHIKKFPALEQEIREAYKLVFERKVLPSMRSLQFAGKPIELNPARIYNCLSADTRFVTRDGVKSFNDFTDGDTTYVLTHKGNWKKATVRNYGIDELYDITIIRGRHSHVTRATSNHRWILKDGTETTSLKVGDELASAPAIFDQFIYEESTPEKTNMSFVVKSIVPSGKEPVWCLEVEDDRSFVLATGEVTGNCSFLPMNHPAAFSELMFLLLSGVGVGYSVQRHHIEQLPAIRKNKKTRRFVVGDSIEGWSDAVKVLVRAYFEGKPIPDFDFRDIRPKGAKLITSGGKAPGPEPLNDALHNIKKIFERKEDGEQLEPIDVHDINCYIADAVLAGGIRRSAMISLFDLDDEEMLTCKFGNFWELNPQRQRANNSATILRHKIDKETFFDLWKKIEASGSGEPGFFMTNDKEWGLNPCITGDALITVRDHDIISDGEVVAEGGVYQIPLKQLVELYETTTLPPMVLSYNTELKQLEWDVLDNAALTREKTSIIELTLDNGETLKLTPDHKVFTENRGWVEAAQLTDEDIGVKVVEAKKIVKSRIVKKTIRENEDVYDLTIRKNHNFFANGLLVHNCAEISLRPNQFCNLTTINASDIADQDDLNLRARVASFIGTLQATYTNFHYLRDIWKKTTEKEALIGVSMTGIASGEVLNLNLAEAAKIVKEENARVAEMLGINKAARTTTVKPEGCMVPETEVKTTNGPVTLQSLFDMIGVDPSQIEEKTFIPFDRDVTVLDENNQEQKIISLYVNGVSEVWDIEMEDGLVVSVTPNHKFLTARGWVRADELVETDEIISY